MPRTQSPSSSTRLAYALAFLQRIALWVLVMLLIQTLIRLTAFFAYRGSQILDFNELLSAFWLGARFDLSATCYALALPLLLAGPWLGIAPVKSFSRLIWVTKTLLLLFSTLMLYILIVDLIYYSYFQDHLNILIFGFLEDDTWAIVQTLWRNYPVIKIFAALGFFVWVLEKSLTKLFASLPKVEVHKTSSLFVVPYLLLTLLISLGARGGLGLFPLGVADTTISTKPFINYLAFQGIHSFHRALKLRARDQSRWNVNAMNYGYKSARAAAADFLLQPQLPDAQDPLEWISRQLPTNTWAEAVRPHVVIIVMESFGAHWITEQSKSFDVLGALAPHLKDDFLFVNFLPSMAATIGSLSSLMIGTPHRPDGGFLTESRYLQVPFRTSPARIYKDQGYATRFLYGGAVGWRDVDKFARSQGFDSIEADNEVEKWKGEPLQKHDWGLYDHDVFAYLQDTLTKAKTPQFVVVMTTTNHPPYQVPTTYPRPDLEIPAAALKRLNIDQRLAEDRFVAYRYANDSIGNFLSNLKNSPLAKNTLVAVTGDHSFLILSYEEQEQLLKWQVPFYLYLPPKIRPPTYQPSTFGSHVDIIATLFPLSLSNIKIPIFGADMFDPKVRHDAFHFSRLALNKEGGVFSENLNKTLAYRWQNQLLEKTPLAELPQLENLSRRYRGLMGFLDEYYEYERKRFYENPRR